MDIEKFKIWLIDKGCEILPPTNPYEKLRFKGSDVGVIYSTNKTSGKYTDEAISAFKNHKKWDGGVIKTGRYSGYKKQKEQILKRDGTCCFYCGLEMGEDITVEHLVDLKYGGKNELSNMVLSHLQCNNKVGKMNLVEKIKFAFNNKK